MLVYFLPNGMRYISTSLRPMEHYRLNWMRGAVSVGWTFFGGEERIAKTKVVAHILPAPSFATFDVPHSWWYRWVYSLIYSDRGWSGPNPNSYKPFGSPW